MSWFSKKEKTIPDPNGVHVRFHFVSGKSVDVSTTREKWENLCESLKENKDVSLTSFESGFFFRHMTHYEVLKTDI